MKVDTLIQNVQVYNSYFKQFGIADVAILDGKFFYIGEHAEEKLGPAEIIDGTGKYMIPGLIDIHLHIESTMVTPAAFSHGLIQNGVTTIVPEPHEMANVFGLRGVKEMIKASEACTVDMMYSIPSSVPATHMETTGGSIEIEDMEELLQTEEIKCLGEIMNYYDVITDPKGKTNQILSYMRAHHPELIVEGHVPRLLDLELQRIIYAGITSDHTHQTIEGMKQRIGSGMFVEIQEKSMTQEIIDYLSNAQVAEHFCFVTDDVMADKFVREGHLNVLLRKAIRMGMTPEDAVYACTYTPAKRMQMHDRGIIAPGKIADFSLVTDIEHFAIDSVYKSGICAYTKDVPAIQKDTAPQFPDDFYQSIQLEELSEADAAVKLDLPDGDHFFRVMEIKDGSTFTRELHKELPVVSGEAVWESSDCGLLMTFERYGKNGNRGFGFVTGDTIKTGAIATSYSHDNHNLLVVGRNKKDMILAANEVIRCQGGISCVQNGELISMLKLPVGGILSEDSLEVMADEVDHLTQSMKRLGYKHYNVIMSLSTLSLPVSPALKLTDYGLIQVNEGRVAPLVVSS